MDRTQILSKFNVHRMTAQLPLSWPISTDYSNLNSSNGERPASKFGNVGCSYRKLGATGV
jgi:hypothetical protein